MPGSFQNGRVQERVTGAIGEFHEAEALFRVEPFYDRVERRAAWCCIFPRCPAE
jgi:hypothetical protein